MSLGSDGGGAWGAGIFLVADGDLGACRVLVFAGDRVAAGFFFFSFLDREVLANFFLVPLALDLDEDFLRFAAEGVLALRFLPDAFFAEDFFFVFLATW